MIQPSGNVFSGICYLTQSHHKASNIQQILLYLDRWEKPLIFQHLYPNQLSRLSM